MSEYWFNIRTRQVEEGAQSNWKKLLGPYPTRQEAEQALQKVQQNNEEWEDDEDS